MSFFSRIFGSSPMKLSQTLGAYPLPNGDVSPLHVFFTVENASGEEVEIASVRVSPKGEDAPLAEGEIKGEVPARLAAKESARFEVRAKTLASAAKNAGHSGTPRLSFVATDGEGVEHRHAFTLRVDEYLALKDE
ncbi:MAG: hypothetical protein M3494_16165 [Actinomycetota bacterium]|jgi:hypothetical protein|nr:hypothetical protein [Rubrobacter sp.]MDQ3509520.1 hypothetical protein [Actinomycetota bacterium]